MPYSRINFITPVSDTDKILRICNVSGVLTHLIRESTATVKQQGNYLNVKQSAESNAITLDFGDEQEAVAALVLLRDALSIIGKNTGVNNSGNSGSGWTNGNQPSPVDDKCDNDRLSVLLSDIWTQSDLIPNTAPGSTSGVVQKFVDLPLIYVSGTSYDNPQFIDIVPPNYGDGVSYAIVLRTAAGVLIPPSMYKVDLGCGRVKLNTFINQGGMIVDRNSPPKVSFYKYVGTKGVFIIPPPPDANKLSSDLKNEHPVTTTMDGQLVGISGLIHQPVGVVLVDVNGVGCFVGNGCTNTSFYAPTWECMFVSDNIGVNSNTTNTITLSVASTVVVNDYIIVRHNSGNSIDCFRVTAATSSVITLSGNITGAVLSMNKVRNYIQTTVGDKLVWFGSFAGYELDPTDRIMTKYLEVSN